MSDLVWVTLISTVPSTIAAIAAVVGAMKGRSNGFAIDEVHGMVNSQREQLQAKLDEALRQLRGEGSS